MADIVERYLRAVATQDWDVVDECMKLGRMTYANDTLAYAQLTETVQVDGKPMVTPEVLVFELTDDGRIARVEIFIQTPPG